MTDVPVHKVVYVGLVLRNEHLYRASLNVEADKCVAAAARFGLPVFVVRVGFYNREGDEGTVFNTRAGNKRLPAALEGWLVRHGVLADKARGQVVYIINWLRHDFRPVPKEVRI